MTQGSGYWDLGSFDPIGLIIGGMVLVVGLVGALMFAGLVTGKGLPKVALVLALIPAAMFGTLALGAGLPLLASSVHVADVQVEAVDAIAPAGKKPPRMVISDGSTVSVTYAVYEEAVVPGLVTCRAHVVPLFNRSLGFPCGS